METESPKSIFRFRGGHPALDLTATLTGRLKAVQRELLVTPADLAQWLAQAGLAEAGAVVSQRELAVAHSLREAIYMLASAAIAGKALPDASVDMLNAIAACPQAVPELGYDGRIRLVGNAGALLARLAGDAALLLGGPERARLRQCDGASCAILFVDRSRRGDRRWCSMRGCGNKAKVDAFRGKKKADAATG